MAHTLSRALSLRSSSHGFPLRAQQGLAHICASNREPICALWQWTCCECRADRPHHLSPVHSLDWRVAVYWSGNGVWDDGLGGTRSIRGAKPGGLNPPCTGACQPLLFVNSRRCGISAISSPSWAGEWLLAEAPDGCLTPRRLALCCTGFRASATGRP